LKLVRAKPKPWSPEVIREILPLAKKGEAELRAIARSEEKGLSREKEERSEFFRPTPPQLVSLAKARDFADRQVS